jgi:hypothetical protein
MIRMHSLRICALLFVASLLASCAHRDVLDTPTLTRIELRFIGEQTIPHRAELAGSTFGGISGIDYDETRNLFYLLSDDRSQNGASRFYTARLLLSANALGKPEILSSVSIKRADGQPHGDAKTDPQNVLDPEAIRYRKASDTLLWTSEGDKRLNLSPFVREMKLDGTFIRELPTLPMFAMKSENKGPRDNATFEALRAAARHCASRNMTLPPAKQCDKSRIRPMRFRIARYRPRAMRTTACLKF